MNDNKKAKVEKRVNFRIRFLIFCVLFRKNHVYLSPIMRSIWFKYLMTVILLVTYINRGLFIAAPGVETFSAHSASGNEINSLLEIIINCAGGQNNIDEDGDSPETYSAAQIFQPLIAPSSMYLTYPNATVRNVFFRFNETILSLYNYGTIDHPPEQ